MRVLEGEHELGKKMIEGINLKPPDEDLFKIILYVACVRIVCGIESIILMSMLGNSADTVLVLRSIFDLLVNIRYIQKKDQKLRSLLFTREEVTALERFYERKVEDGSISAEEYHQKHSHLESQRNLFDKEIFELKPGFKMPTGSRWSGKSFEKMAEEGGLKAGYDTIYWLLSAVSHSTGSANHVFVRFDSDTLSPKFYPNEEYIGQVTRTAALFSLELLSIVDDYLQLGNKQGIEQLHALHLTTTK